MICHGCGHGHAPHSPAQARMKQKCVFVCVRACVYMRCARVRVRVDIHVRAMQATRMTHKRPVAQAHLLSFRLPRTQVVRKDGPGYQSATPQGVVGVVDDGPGHNGARVIQCRLQAVVGLRVCKRVTFTSACLPQLHSLVCPTLATSAHKSAWPVVRASALLPPYTMLSCSQHQHNVQLGCAHFQL